MTNNPVVLQAIERVAMETKLKRLRIAARDMAERLCVALHVLPFDRELVPLLSNDQGIRTNRDAIASWVMGQVADAETLDAYGIEEIMKVLLRRKFDGCEENTSCK